MDLVTAAEIMGCSFQGENQPIHTIRTDSRYLQPGDLFFAIAGDKFDGHSFVNTAADNGAIAAVIQAPVGCNRIPLLKVKDTREALGQLAAYHRQQMFCKTIAVTGSCGKTTTRVLLENIFMQHGPTIASQKSFNNNIGVPLTLLRLLPEHEYLITELGASHPGEIAYLTDLVRPDVAIITNANAVHLEGFVSLDGVSRGKGEIFEGLAAGGIAVLNRDDVYFGYWKELNHGHRIITFGLKHKADVSARNLHLDQSAKSRFELVLPKQTVSVSLQLMGQHNVMNALAAAAAAVAMGLSAEEIQSGLEAAQPEQKRLVEYIGISGARVIDDSYNANPASVGAAIAILNQRPGYKVLVLGDMLEMGEHAQRLHTQIGEQAAQLGIDSLYCFGKETRHTAQAFGDNAFYFERQEDLIKSLTATLVEDMTVLIKGSHAMKMDRVTQALIARVD